MTLEDSDQSYDDMLAHRTFFGWYAKAHMQPYLSTICKPSKLVKYDLDYRRKTAAHALDITSQAKNLLGDKYPDQVTKILISSALDHDLDLIDGVDNQHREEELKTIIYRSLNFDWSDTAPEEGWDNYAGHEASNMSKDSDLLDFYLLSIVPPGEFFLFYRHLKVGYGAKADSDEIDTSTIIIDRLKYRIIPDYHVFASRLDTDLPLAHADDLAITLWPALGPNELNGEYSSDDWQDYLALRGVQIERPESLDVRETRSGVELGDEGSMWSWFVVLIDGVKHRVRAINSDVYTHE